MNKQQNFYFAFNFMTFIKKNLQVYQKNTLFIKIANNVNIIYTYDLYKMMTLR